MKILITGGAGYLGSILSKKLLGKGYQVRVMNAFNEFKIKYEAGEIKDYKNSKYNNYNSLINSKEMQEKVFFKEL